MRERLRERFCSICCAYWFKTYENCPVRTNVVPVFLKFKMSVRRSTWILPEISKINKFKCIFCIKQSEVTEKYEQAWIDRQAKNLPRRGKPSIHLEYIFVWDVTRYFFSREIPHGYRGTQLRKENGRRPL